MIQVAVLIITSILLIAISWKSLRKPNSHGFYRFFVWEAIAALVVINAPVWFKSPASWNQIISWILLIACFVPLGFGVQSLRTQGKPTEQRAGDSSLMSFEKTTQLVTSGIYHYIR
ncbi:MAG TPA: hypothetical protein VMT73_02665, partial [Anaerolineales bacterium]|nr:hypothetical protein [Anaerolineales bacterium]